MNKNRCIGEKCVLVNKYTLSRKHREKIEQQVEAALAAFVKCFFNY